MVLLILNSEGERVQIVEGMGKEIERRCRIPKIGPKIESASQWDPVLDLRREIWATNSIVVLAWPSSCFRLSA